MTVSRSNWHPCPVLMDSKMSGRMLEDAPARTHEIKYCKKSNVSNSFRPKRGVGSFTHWLKHRFARESVMVWSYIIKYELHQILQSATGISK